MSTVILWVLVAVAVEVFVFLIMLGAWISEGHRRDREIERLEDLLRRSGARGEDSSRR